MRVRQTDSGGSIQIDPAVGLVPRITETGVVDNALMFRHMGHSSNSIELREKLMKLFEIRQRHVVTCILEPSPAWL